MAANTRKHGSKSETVRKLTKTGSYTFYVTIPKVYIDELGWKERQNVVVKKAGQKIVIEGLKKTAKKK